MALSVGAKASGQGAELHFSITCLLFAPTVVEGLPGIRLRQMQALTVLLAP